MSFWVPASQPGETFAQARSPLQDGTSQPQNKTISTQAARETCARAEVQLGKRKVREPTPTFAHQGIAFPSIGQERRRAAALLYGQPARIPSGTLSPSR